ncbi:replication termination factor 2 isoform X2 [Anopheles gambiae]|uniref:replication termination factor 2 isoform X2 n=1 Tax=Anopheles gambiae TaxID=7165 RepID=UPI002AC8F829|nr:replication termination factor 2 isoform X2 [Anopheles gambiae]
MGCDGGTIPRRDELVRLKKKPEQKDKDAERQFRWKHCALTQQRLQQPIVMCGLGRLYAKQNVIEALLDKEKMTDACAHIKSMKDIKNLNLTSNPAYDETKDDKSSPYICALIGLEMSGQFRFVALWTCGCVFSERALKEVKDRVCSVCQTPYTDDDIVILNGTEDEIEQMRVKMEARNARAKAEKKAKLDKKSKTKAASATITSGEASEPVATPPEQSSAAAATASASTIAVSDSADGKGSSTVDKKALPSMARANGEGSSKAKPIVLNKRALISDKIGEDPVFKKSKDDYSVAKDPKASAVYKSLFTSHESEKDQKRAHWVTYNPFYN